MTSNSTTTAPKLSSLASEDGETMSKATPKISAITTEIPHPDNFDTALSTDLEAYILAIDDILSMTQDERQLLLQGPRVRIQADGEVADTLPFRLLLAASSLVRDMYLNSSKRYRAFINFTKLDKVTVKGLLAYLKDTAAMTKCFRLQKSRDDQTHQDLLLLRTVELLGMQHLFSHIGEQWLEIMTNPVGRVPKHNETTSVEMYCSQNDKLFKAVPQRLARCATDETMFAEYMAALPKLSVAVGEIRKGNTGKEAAAAHEASMTGHSTGEEAHRESEI